MRLEIGALLLFAATAAAQDRPIDAAHSTITIHVGKSGLLSSAGHDHTINAPIASGAIHETAPAHVEFTVDAASMTVQPDPKVDARTQATIQQDMQEMTLESKKFPEIRFQSTRVDKLPTGDWKVQGDLALHGTTKPVTLTVKQDGEAWATHTVLRQTDFGIKPISVGGGMIKVKNEIDLDFRIVAAPAR